MRDSIFKRYKNLVTITVSVSYLFAQWLTGCLFVFWLMLGAEMLDILYVLSLRPFFFSVSWSLLVMTTMLLVSVSLALTYIYSRKDRPMTRLQVTCWLLAHLGQGMSLATLSMLMYIAYKYGMNAIVPVMDTLLVFLFICLLIAAGANMRLQDEIVGVIEHKFTSGYLKIRTIHNVLLAFNLFVVTILTYTGVESLPALYALGLVMASVITVVLFERIVTLSESRMKYFELENDVAFMNTNLLHKEAR